MLVERDGLAGACKQPAEVATGKRQQQQEQLGALKLSNSTILRSPEPCSSCTGAQAKSLNRLTGARVLRADFSRRVMACKPVAGHGNSA